MEETAVQIKSGDGRKRSQRESGEPSEDQREPVKPVIVKDIVRTLKRFVVNDETFDVGFLQIEFQKRKKPKNLKKLE